MKRKQQVLLKKQKPILIKNKALSTVPVNLMGIRSHSELLGEQSSRILGIPGISGIPGIPGSVPSQMSTVDRALLELSNNKLFIGFVMIMLNIGGRYLSMELPKNVERLFESTWMRVFVVFCISFMGTRDIKIATIITLLFVILMKYLFHEESMCCILPEKISQESIAAKQKQQQREEQMKAKLAGLGGGVGIKAI